MDSKISIQKISDREYSIGSLSMKLIDGNISYSQPINILTLEMAQKAHEVHLIFRNRLNAPVNVLIDLNRANGSSTEMRDFWEKVATDDQIYNKVALFGLHPVARVLAAFEIGVSKIKKKMRFFKTKEDAIKWLQE